MFSYSSKNTLGLSKSFVPAQNILWPVEGRGISKFFFGNIYYLIVSKISNMKLITKHLSKNMHAVWHSYFLLYLSVRKKICKTIFWFKCTSYCNLILKRTKLEILKYVWILKLWYTVCNSYLFIHVLFIKRNPDKIWHCSLKLFYDFIF